MIFGDRKNFREGFTLIELSIVLVIIGLIVGGVLTGQDLIRTAAVRAQITQIEKYNTAVNTFRGKYGALPGDLKSPDATNFGFSARGQYAGEGDGNGLIEGVTGNNAASNNGIYMWMGETTTFWRDLSTAFLVEGGYNLASETALPPNGDFTPSSSPNIQSYYPQAKIGTGNFIYAYSGNSVNYFGLSALTDVGSAYTFSTTGITVQQAYAIDRKMDDGFPQLGNVTALYVNATLNGSAPAWAGGPNSGASDTSATAGLATTCFDNSTAASGTPGIAGATQHYSLEISNGNNVNCAVSFRFQ